MKPRRWYSSPELNPHPTPPPSRPFPAVIYWAFTTLTHLEQGSIIKTAPAEAPQAPHSRGATTRVANRLRRIDAA